MVTTRRSVKHTRRQRRCHTKTKKKLSKRYRGRKGYNKRITRRHMRRSDNIDIINTQGGGSLTIWSAAKTFPGKALELKIISRFLLKNIKKIINKYIQSMNLTLQQFYTNIDDPTYLNALPSNVQNALKLQNEVIRMSNTAAHDLPDDILVRYNQLFPRDEDNDVSLVTTEATELEDDENGDEIATRVTGNIEQNILTGISSGNVSIKAKKIEDGQDPMSASIDSGDAVTFLDHIFNPSGVPFIMIVVFYTQNNYILPQLPDDQIRELLEQGVTTTGEPRRGSIIFVRKIVKIDMTNAIRQICGTLTLKQKKVILMELELASGYVKSQDERERERGKSICKEVDRILTAAEALLRVSTKDNDDEYTKNRIQARLLVNLSDLARYIQVDHDPTLSPIGSMVSTPTISTAKKARGVSFGDVQRQALRRDQETKFLNQLKPGIFAKKTHEEIGEIVMKALLKSSNPVEHLQRIYHAQQSKVASKTPSASAGRKGASKTPSASAGRKGASKTPSSSAGRKPPASAPRSTTPASASKTPSQGASSKSGAISRPQTGLSRISERSIYDRRIFPPSRSSTRVSTTTPISTTTTTPMEEVD